MISKNNILLISTQSVFNTENVNNGIESNSESNGMNIDESINLDTGERTSWMDVDESIKLNTGVGTERVYGVEVSPGKVNSESTISTDKGESVLGGNRFMGVFMDDPYNSPDKTWIPSKFRVGGGDPFGIVSTNIWLDSREGKDWLGRIGSEKLILQSLHSIYGNHEKKGEGNNETVDCCEDTRPSTDTLRIIKAAALHSGYELKIVRRKGYSHEESRVCEGVDDTVQLALFYDENMVKISRKRVPNKQKVSSYKRILDIKHLQACKRRDSCYHSGITRWSKEMI